MKIRKFYRLYILGFTLLFLLPGMAAGQAPRGTELGSSFTYQGQLKSDGEPFTGSCRFHFLLFNSEGADTPIGETNIDNVAVSEGLFTVKLDFGSGYDLFNGDERWLEIWVQCPSGIGDYQTLYPRQLITATPYALYAPDAGHAILADGVPWAGIENMPVDFSDGIDNEGWLLTGNAGTSASTNYLGTSDEQALEIRVNNQRVFRFSPHETSPNLVGGYFGNEVTDGVFGAAISGGGVTAYTNRVTDIFGTIGGGIGNLAGNNDTDTSNSAFTTVSGGESNMAFGSGSTVGGGSYNLASGSDSTVSGGDTNTASGYMSTVSGGYSNTASGNSSTVSGGDTNTASAYCSTVGGGYSNTASGNSSTISGGNTNTASGYYATVPGGVSNIAAGSMSFAAGYRAKANNNGCFVWGDVSQFDLNCDNDNRWIARASGGVYFYTNGDSTSGSYLANNGSSWNAVSNRDLKENFTPVNSSLLLENLSQFPITTWNYKAQDDAILHIGMMADEFNSLVDGLGGEGEDYINSMDAVGVAMAAAQGLYAENQDLKARVEDLEARMAILEEMVANGNVQKDQAILSTPWLFGLGLLVIGGVYIIRRRPGGGL